MKIVANPVLVKELRGRIRGARPLILLTVYLSLTGIITLLTYVAIVGSLRSSFGELEIGRVIGKSLFITVMATTLTQVSIITPSLTSGSIVGEKERQSYDLLISTLLSPLQIAFGKLGAALAYAILLIVAVLPLAGLSFLFGGVSGAELLIGIIGLVVTAVWYATVGLFWSTVMRTTLAATVMSLGSILLVLLGIPFIFVISRMIIDFHFPNENEELYVYGMGALLCTHPFISLGLTEVFLNEGKSAFWVDIPVNGKDILAPSPWIGFTFIGIALTIMFLFLSVRLLKPVQYNLPKRKREMNNAD